MNRTELSEATFKTFYVLCTLISHFFHGLQSHRIQNKNRKYCETRQYSYAGAQGKKKPGAKFNNYILWIDFDYSLFFIFGHSTVNRGN